MRCVLFFCRDGCHECCKNMSCGSLRRYDVINTSLLISNESNFCHMCNFFSEIELTFHGALSVASNPSQQVEHRFLEKSFLDVKNVLLTHTCLGSWRNEEKISRIRVTKPTILNNAMMDLLFAVHNC